MKYVIVEEPRETPVVVSLKQTGYGVQVIVGDWYLGQLRNDGVFELYGSLPGDLGLQLEDGGYVRIDRGV